jgi:hypothetical protein
MATWYVPASLRSIFNELDATWPNRAHKLDGTIGDSHHCPGTSDHCPDANGWIHAIDIDKNGIDPDYVVGKISNPDNVVRYINWNGYQYHVRNDFRPRPLTEADKHTTHIHVSIEHTAYARGFTGPWGIFPQIVTVPIVIPDLSTTPDTNWDHSSFVTDIAGDFQLTGDYLSGYSNAFAQLRG